VTSSRSARRARRDERRRRAALSTEPITGLRTADWDATTITFAGASGTGLPDDGVGVIEFTPAEPIPPWDGTEAGAAAAFPRPPAALRAQPRYQPQPPPPAGYSATTGPMPALGRPAISIGDALAHDETWGPKIAPLPCGHCGTPPPVPGDILERTRILGLVNWLAVQAGWRIDTDFIWTCPPCQQGETWRARQGQLEVRWPDGGYCVRHDDGAGDRCDCPSAVLATDVMLTSHDYLRTGRAISIRILRDTQAGGR
jgi:hypothetical protein